LKTSALFLFESVPCQFLTLVGKIYRKANGCFVDVSDEKRWMRSARNINCYHIRSKETPLCAPPSKEQLQIYSLENCRCSLET
jgi:hypothetical protein